MTYSNYHMLKVIYNTDNPSIHPSIDNPVTIDDMWCGRADQILDQYLSEQKSRQKTISRITYTVLVGT